MLLMSRHLHCSPRNKAQAFKQHKVCFTHGSTRAIPGGSFLPSNSEKLLLMDPLPTCALLCSIFVLGELVNGQMVIFHLNNKCPFPVWPAAAPNAGHPVIADGGFLLPPNQTKRVHAPPTWNGRFWGRTGCDFTTTSKPGCQTGDCQGLLSCNGTIGTPPATLVEVALQEDQSKPSFYDVSVVDGYNLPITVSTKPAYRKCWIGGCTKSINSVCPQELQVLDHSGAAVVACKSACLAFDLDVFCCRNSYGKPETCKPSVYSAMFKDACPSYFSYAYDTSPPLVNCYSREYAITFCPSRWGSLLSQEEKSICS